MDIKTIGEFIGSVGAPTAIVFAVLYFGYKLASKGADILSALKTAIDHQSMMIEQQCKQNEETSKKDEETRKLLTEVWNLLRNLNGTLKLRRAGSKKKAGGKRATD